MNSQFANMQIDTTACFQSSDVKNQIYYKIELVEFNQASFWVFSPTASKSQMAKQISKRFGEVYFVAETIIPHGQYVETFLSMSDRDLFREVQEKRNRILVLNKVKKNMIKIIELSKSDTADLILKQASVQVVDAHRDAISFNSNFYIEHLDHKYERWNDLRKARSKKPGN
jgi:hypothetical protein